jgi:RNA 3'-phosphate cyclase
MIEIDGSIGGGQILRTAVGLSALTLKPFRITNIRKNRPKPGLKAQHLAGVKVSGEICQAEIIFSDRPVQIQAKGGTAGLGAPTAEYTKFVIFPILAKLGITAPDLEILRQGFYPRGGGVIRVKFSPIKQLKSLKLIRCGELQNIRGFSIAGKLPESVAQRQAEAAKRVLSENGFDSKIESTAVRTNSAGTSLTIIAQCQSSILGSDDIGKLGKRAEKVGEDTANSLVVSIKSGKAFDKFMSDQIIPFIALAKGRSEIAVEDYTDHVRSNILATEKMLDVKFAVNQKENTIAVYGIGYKG